MELWPVGNPAYCKSGEGIWAVFGGEGAQVKVAPDVAIDE
jgi:hypothetical protein